MTQPKQPSSGGKIGPRRDRKAMHKYAKDVLNSLPNVNQKHLAPKKLNHLAQVIEASQAAGRFNNRDAAQLGKLLQKINRESPVDNPNNIAAFRRLNKLNRYSTNLSDEPGKGRQPNSFVGTHKNPHVSGNGKKHRGLGVLAPGKIPGTKADKSNDGNNHSKNRPAPHNGKRHGGGGRGNGNGNFSQPGMIYYGLGDFPGVSRKQAKTIVGRDINQQVRELMGDARADKKAMQYDINQANTLFNRTRDDLNHIYGTVGNYIGNQNQKINQRFNNTDDQVAQIYQTLQNTQDQQTDQTRDAAMAELQRLGIQQTGMGQYDADANFLQGLGAQANANTQANLQAMQTGSAEIGNLLASMSQAALASAVGRATNARQDSISDTRQAGRADMQGILEQIRNIKAGRPQAVNELHSAMEQNAYQRWAETQQADFNNQLAANQFNLDVSKLNSDNLWEKARLRQEARRQAAVRRQQKQFQKMQNEGQALNSDLAALFTDI